MGWSRVDGEGRDETEINISRKLEKAVEEFLENFQSF
jgi:hypothetical protein